MAFDSEFQKKLQVFLVVAIVIAGGRAAYVVYERHEAMKEDTQPKQDAGLKADYDVTPKKLHPYDLKSAHQLTAQPVWVKLGYQLTYYPYDRERRKTDFEHEAGLLLPLQKLAIQDVVVDVSPKAPGIRQVMAVFSVYGMRVMRSPLGRKRVTSSRFIGRHFLYRGSARSLQALAGRGVERG